MHSPGVVVVRVRGEGRDRLAQLLSCGLAQARDAEARVDHQVSIAATNVPHVAANQGIDVGLHELRYTEVALVYLEPLLGDPDTHPCILRSLDELGVRP